MGRSGKSIDMLNVGKGMEMWEIAGGWYGKSKTKLIGEFIPWCLWEQDVVHPLELGAGSSEKRDFFLIVMGALQNGWLICWTKIAGTPKLADMYIYIYMLMMTRVPPKFRKPAYVGQPCLDTWVILGISFAIREKEPVFCSQASKIHPDIDIHIYI